MARDALRARHKKPNGGADLVVAYRIVLEELDNDGKGARVLCGVVCVCVPSFGVDTDRLTNSSFSLREVD